MDIKMKIEKRGICNALLMYIVSLHLKMYGDHLRFIQSLWGLGIIDGLGEEDQVKIVDRFYEEPYDTLKRISHRISIVLEEAVAKGYRDEDFDINTQHLKDLGIIKV